jgi:hypothetical protein
MSKRPQLSDMASAAQVLDDQALEQAVRIASDAAAEQRPARLARGHKWCVYSANAAVKRLREAGIRSRAVQTPDWHYRPDPEGHPQQFVTRKDCGFQHAGAHDPSHTWIELEDGTILDPTISQFKIKRDWPSLRGMSSVAVVRPGDEYASYYDATPLAGNEHVWTGHSELYSGWGDEDGSSLAL